MPVRAVLRTTGTTLLLVLGGVVPFVGILSVLLAPLPVAVLAARERAVATIPTVVIIGILFALVGGVWAGIISMLWLLGLGVLIGVLTRGGMALRNVVAAGASATVLFFVVWISLLNVIGGVDLYGDGVQTLRDTLQADSPILEELFTAEALEQIKDSLPEVSKQLPYLIPTVLIFVILASAVSVTAGLIRILEKNSDPANRRIPPFVLWRIPWYLSWGFVLSLAALTVPDILGSGEALVSVFEGLGNGGLLLLGPFYLVQGAAIVTFHIRRRTQSTVLLGAVLAVLLFVPLLSQAVLFVGLFDTWFDLRKLDRDKEEAYSPK